MGKIKWLFLFIIFSIGFISAGYSNCEIYGNCEPVTNAEDLINAINYTNVNVNNSQFLRGYYDYVRNLSSPTFTSTLTTDLLVNTITKLTTEKVNIKGYTIIDNPSAPLRLLDTTGTLSNNDLIVGFRKYLNTFVIGDYATGVKGLTINTTAGRVGINTNNPSYDLEVVNPTGNAQIGVRAVTAGRDAEWKFGTNSYSYTVYLDDTDGSINFYRGANRVTITQNGLVGIGITPTNNLTVSGDGNFTGDLYTSGIRVNDYLYNQTSTAKSANYTTHLGSDLTGTDADFNRALTHDVPNQVIVAGRTFRNQTDYTYTATTITFLRRIWNDDTIQVIS